MKKNTKITLTLGQLKKLVNETVFDQKELRALANESVDKESIENKLYYVLKQEAMDFSSNYTNPLDLWDIDVITREDRDEYQAGGASPGSEYGYAVKWGYDAAVDIALEDHEWTYVMVYEEPESEDELKNQYTFDDVVNIITQSHLRDKYEEIQCGSFEHGHFKYIVFVEKESKAKATLNENSKITLTLAQIKKLVKEAKAWPREIEYDDEEFDTPVKKASKKDPKIAGKIKELKQKIDMLKKEHDDVYARYQRFEDMAGTGPGTQRRRDEYHRELTSLSRELSDAAKELKKLRKNQVKEGTAPAVDPVAAIEEDLSDILDKIDAWRTDGSMEHWQYVQLFDLADDALAKLDEVKKPEAVKEDALETTGSDEEFKKAVAELLYVSDEVLGWASNSTDEIVDDQYCKKFMSIWDKVAKFVEPQPPEGN